LDILQDPTRIFNGDKSSFQFFPNTGKVLACKWDRNVYEVDRGLTKASITAMFTFSAFGMMFPPMWIYPYKRIPSAFTHRLPVVWSMTITYIMFEETVVSQHVTELKIRRKNEAEPALKIQIYKVEEMSLEDLEIPGSNIIIMQN
jgi:hypothetical protein